MFTLIRLRTRSSATLVGLLVGLLAAGCGGKTPTAPSGDSGNPTPTAVLTNTNATATALATEAKNVLSVGLKAAQIPTAISLLSAPTGVVTVTNCPAGGNITFDYPTAFTSGTRYTTTYNNCQYATGYAINGTITVTYSSFANAGNFSWTSTYNLNYTGYGFTYSGSQTCNYVNNVASCYYSEGGRTLGTNFSYNVATNVANGTYSWTYEGAGTVRYTLANWGPTSGTIQVVGANNTSATILRTSANSYSVTINGGTPYTLTL